LGATDIGNLAYIALYSKSDQMKKKAIVIIKKIIEIRKDDIEGVILIWSVM
jgi:hypothetical protein